MIKTRNGTNIQLRCADGWLDDKGGTYDPATTNVYPFKARVHYDISEADLEKIMDEGVSKVRIEMYDRNIDDKYKAVDPGAYIAECHRLLDNRINERTGFSDGF